MRRQETTSKRPTEPHPMRPAPPSSALKHDSSVASQASPPSSSHYWVTENLTSLHMPPPTSKFPKEMSRPHTHTHPHTHTYTLKRTHPVTNDHGNTSLKIFSQGLSAGVALALGSKLFRDPRHGGRRGLIPLDGSPQDMKLGKGGQKSREAG